MFTGVYLCLPFFNHGCLPMFTDVYFCLPVYRSLLVFTYVYYMFVRVYLYLAQLTCVYLCVLVFNC